MSAPNFNTMANFPLIVADNTYCKVCPECGLTCDKDEETCPDCETSLKDVEERFDDLAMEYTCSEMQRAADKVNEDLTFHKVRVESGRYVGVQFYVDEEFNGFGSLDGMDNEEAQYYYGMCRSKMLRKYKTECNKIRRWLLSTAMEMGLERLGCVGIFSNGEAVYTRIDLKNGPTLRQAAKMASA